ncbi:hypothetical protein L3V16_06165 [Brucella ciceri]|uniref:hypothetical protein n=1 Tax=Brucella ciceri TaxID=391287 RepID=UPI001F13C78E|nr:hypothetical protein [Brucella ciceri]MCH6203424.1 hypothetical protein [Brucella ciceri]
MEENRVSFQTGENSNIVVSSSGAMGKLVGTKDHAPNNIVLLSLILLFVAFFCVLFAPIDQDLSRQTLVTAILSAITFSIGLLYGKHG